MIVAHRGASHDAPENTLAAFELAWKQGTDTIRGDFHLTHDHEIIYHRALSPTNVPGKLKAKH